MWLPVGITYESAFGRFHIPDLILGIQSVEENEVIEAEVTVGPEPAESKLDKVNNLLSGVTDKPQEQAETESQPVPTPHITEHQQDLPPAPSVVLEVDDFF